MAAGFHLARAQDQRAAQVQAARDRRQRRFAHQLGAGAGQCAFVGLGPARVQRFGDDQPDQRIAQEFQALVVRRAGAAMGQGLLEQARVREGMATENGCHGVLAAIRCRRRRHGSILHRVESADDIDVVDHRLADFVIDFHFPAVLAALSLTFSGFTLSE